MADASRESRVNEFMAKRPTLAVVLVVLLAIALALVVDSVVEPFFVHWLGRDGSYAGISRSTWNTIVTAFFVGTPIIYFLMSVARQSSRHYKKELRAYEENERVTRRLKTLTDFVPGAICEFEVSPEGNFACLYSSRSFGELFGADAGSAGLANHVFAHVVDDDRRKLAESLEDTKRTGAFVSEFRILVTETIRWVRVSARLTGIGSGGTLRLVGFVSDVSDSVLLRDTTRTHEQLISQYLEVLPVAVFVTDARGHIERVNAEASRLTGFSRSALLKLRVQDLVSDQDAVRATEWFQQLGMAPADIELNINRANGDSFPGSVHAARLDDRFLVGYLRDLTSDRAREQELRESRDMAQAAVEARDRLLVDVSHEVRTPLHAIIGLSSLLARDAEDDNQDRVRLILHSAELLLTLVNDLMDAGGRELQLQKGPFSPQALLSDAIAMVQPEAELRHIELLHESEGDVPARCEADASRISQVLLNLLRNAIKFTPEGQVKVKLQHQRETNGTQLIRFEIRDTGIGIDPVHHERIFEAFYRAENADTVGIGGLGIGLSIARRMVTLMGGDVGLDSELGQGSSFWFHVPVKVSEEAESVQSRPTHELSRPCSVLVVEDNPVNQLVTARMVERLGHAVRIAATGAEALNLAKNWCYDLVLMDCQMPQMDGYEATRRLRAQGINDPILALTASAQPSVRDACMSSGMNDVLVKPISLGDLGEAIARWTTAQTTSTV